MTRRLLAGAALVALFFGPATLGGEPTYEDARLDPSDPGEYAQFGISCDVDGDTLVVGARAAGVYGEGAAYVFERGDEGWEEVARLEADEVHGGDEFGHSVAISGDTIVVGCPKFGADAGAVCVYERIDGVWAFVGRYSGSLTGQEDNFGWSVAIDGDTFVVGAPYDESPYIRGGAAWVFVREGAGWVEQASLFADEPAVDDVFGTSVGIDGDAVVVSAPYVKLEEDRHGAAYVFARAEGEWSLTQKLTHATQSEQGEFGFSVAIDRGTVVVGAPDQAVLGERTGGAFVFVWDGSDETFKFRQVLSTEERLAGENFGFSVDIDGGAIAVGANNDYRIDPGAGYVFVLAESWTLLTECRSSDGEEYDRLGMSAAIDGATAVFGADGVTPGTGFPVYYGAAYVYEDLAVPPPPPPLPPPAERGFLLPRKVDLQAPAAAKAPASGSLVAVGTADLGPEPPDLEAPGTLTVGARTWAVPGLSPVKKGKAFAYSGDGVSIAIRPAAKGGSRAKFEITATGLVPGEADADGEIDIGYSVGEADLDCRLRLVGGSFRLGRTAGGLVAPGLCPMKLKARVRGGGRDSLKLLAGLAGDGTVPEPAPALAVRAAGAFEAVVPGDAFRRKGDRLAFRGDAGGVRKAVIDFAKGRILVVLKNVDLGAIDDGAVPFQVGVALGEDACAAEVLAVRKGSRLRY